MSGAKHRQKGDRVEREIVEAFKAAGIHSERYPLSGASRFRGSGHDIDVYPFGADQAPLVGEVKSRKSGNGFAMIEKWLGEYDFAVLKRNNAKPLVVLPWNVLIRLRRGKNGDTDAEESSTPKPPQGSRGAEAS